MQAIRLEIGVASDIAVSALSPSRETKMLSITPYRVETSIESITGTDIFIRSLPMGRVPMMFSFVSVIFITS